jgi:hypothetical protein
MADKKISALTASSTPLAGTEVLPIVQGGSTVKVSVANLTAGRAVSASSVAVSRGAVGLVSSFSDGIAQGLVLSSGSGYFGLYNPNYGDITVRDPTNVSTFVTISNLGVVTLNQNNLVIGTAGKGIDFSANANAPGMTSELLTWYEEGVFTPTVFGTGTAGTGTYTFQVGRYVRIGKVVQFQASLAWSAHTGTGDFGGVGGLPFSSASTADNYSIPSIYVSDLALTASNTIQGFIGPSTATIALRQVPVGGGTSSVIPFDTSVSALLITGSYIAA